MRRGLQGKKTRLSDYFRLGISQAELDFVDIPINTDLPLFCDPFAFVIEKDPWFQECNELVYGFFSLLVEHIRQGRRYEAMRMLSHVGEANEAHLGFSRGMPAGLGIGRVKAVQLYERLEQSRAVKTGLLYDLSDCDLFIPGIGPDNISDMTLNIIRRKLLEYTQTQCRQTGIAVSTVQGGFCWNPQLQAWSNEYAKLPVVNGSRVLLVPKAAVRYRLSIEHQEYYRHFVLNFLQAEHLEAGSSLVQLLKNGKTRVTKRSLMEKYPLNKDFLSEFSDQHPDVLDRYRSHATAESLALTDEHIEAFQPEARPIDFDQIVNDLQGIPPGHQTAGDYHRLIRGALEAVFYPQLRGFDVEEKINEGRGRIDIVARNAQSKGFFGDLPALNLIPCPYVMIECKNYSADVGNPEFDQLASRLDERRGRFGLLVCRTVADRVRALSLCKDKMNGGHGYILALDDTDIIQMIGYRKVGDYNAISNHMHGRLRELLF